MPSRYDVMAPIRKRQQTTEDMNAFADWVKARRAFLGMAGQADLTDRMQELAPDDVEVKVSYVGNLEAGRTGIPRQPFLGLLARALEVSQVEVLKQTGLITEDVTLPPVRAQSSEASPFPQGTVKAKIVELLHEVADVDALEVAKFCQFQIDKHSITIDVPVIIRGAPQSLRD